MSDWQPIETAPIDEMFIYFWRRDGKRTVGLAYKARDGGWRDSEGNWNVRIHPTHWMPLPKPPITSASEWPPAHTRDRVP